MRVPQIQPAQVSLNPGRLPTVTDTLDRGALEAPGRALQGLGQQVAQAGQVIQKKVDDGQFEIHNAALSQAALDAETKALAAKGTDAMAAADEAMKSYAAVQQDAEAKANARVRTRLRAAGAARQLDLQRNLNRHQAEQAEVVAEYGTKATRASELADLGAHPDDPITVKKVTENLYGSAEAKARRDGVATPENLAIVRKQVDNEVASTRLGALLASKATSQQAINLYDANEKAGDTKVDLSHHAAAVDQARLDVDEEREFTAITRKYGYGQAAVAEAQKITGDPYKSALSERLVHRIQYMEGAVQARKNQTDRIVMEGLIVKIQKSKPGTPLTQVLTAQELAIAANTEGLLPRLQSATVAHLNGQDVPNDDNYEAELRMIFNDPARHDEATRVGIDRTKLSAAKYADYVEKQAIAKDPTRWANWMDESSVRKLYYGQMNIQNDKTAQSRFDARFDAAVDAWAAEHKNQKPNTEVWKKIAKSLALPMLQEDRTAWIDQVAPTYDIPAGKVTHIPPKAADYISGKLREHGLTRAPTQADYERLSDAEMRQLELIK